ncbi:protein ALP1-like isoform X2 [Temnothorax curvispinosus]|uniref:Protein ALP1-like isoform X2 n=1 Tax=Temnothorax curvispinosus TaxID=300111 RepID=A0A6J1RN60_9HYME|nr:protein ALP1-like isoform X2 [Temnothorax curvispinosus]
MDERRRAVALTAITLSNDFLRCHVIFDTDSETSDSDLDEGDMRRRFQLRGGRRKPPRIKNYVEVTVPRFNTQQFRRHFRMTPATYENLEARLSPILSLSEGKAVIPLRKQLLGSLWLLATPDSYRSVGERFDLAKSSLNKSFMRVVECLNDISGQIILWPRGQDLDRVKADFNQNSLLRGIIGAIDGTHILIKAPKIDSQYYRTYKKTYAIILQAVCDARMKFTDCFAGFAGSVGDLRVFRNSDLWREIQIDKQSFFPNDEFIIGDKAYPVLTWCISPYIDRGQLTAAQIKFNTVLSSKRSVIERAFALLKGRFRRLKFLDMNVDDNICLDGIDENDVEDFIQEGMEMEIEEAYARNIPNEEAGEVKRQYLCALVTEA